MSLILSLDPGVRKIGACLWRDEALEEARLVRSSSPEGFRQELSSWLTAVDAVVCESMAYSVKRTPNPQDLIRVQTMGAYLAGAAPRASFTLYSPKKWKGSVPKKIHHKRIDAELSEQERSLMPSKAIHDVWDACGLGLYHLGRM